MRHLRNGLILTMVIVLAACAPLSTQGSPTAQATAAALVAKAGPQKAVENASSAAIDTSVLATVESTFTGIYQNVNPSVVNIQVTTQANGPLGTNSGGEGSGFVWDAQGHIVTNNHVVENASSITVIFSDGTTANAELVGADPGSDLAVIKVDPAAAALHPVTMGDSQKINVGDLVIAIGNPYGLSGTMTQGIVSALSRSLSADSTADPASSSSYTIPDIIQTDTAINPGNSGGVLVDVNGAVIGVTAAIRSSSGSNSGIGFAIPAHIVNRVVPVLIKDGKYQHPRLGISGTALTPDIAKQVGLDSDQKGILVVDVVSGGPAEKAGLKGADQQVNRSTGETTYTAGDVITALNGKPITNYESLVSTIFNETTVGQTISLTILRGGKEIQVDLTLAALN